MACPRAFNVSVVLLSEDRAAAAKTRCISFIHFLDEHRVCAILQTGFGEVGLAEHPCLLLSGAQPYARGWTWFLG